jgi:hypothetical protein
MAPAATAAPAFVPPGKVFGFHSSLTPPGEPVSSTRTVDAAKAGGAEYMRIGIQWRSFENESNAQNPIPSSFASPLGQPTGHHELDRADREYLQITSRGMKPIMMIHGAPAWASTFHTCLTNLIHQLDKNKCPDGWRTKALVLFTALDRRWQLHEFARAVALRYPEAVIEGTNEPDFQQQFQPQYHPPVETVASGQCALRDGVKAADPNRIVLSAGLYIMKYLEEYVRMIAGRNCFDFLSFHLFGSIEVRAGFASGPQAHLERLRNALNTYQDGKDVWLTESGLTNTVRYNNPEFTNDTAIEMGEPLVARAYPRFVTDLLNAPDIAGLLVHSVREGSFGEVGTQFGFGLLRPDFTVKTPGDGSLPRWCWHVLSAGNSYPGCEGYSLPGPAAPAAPSFYKDPTLLWGSQTTVGKDSVVLFLEDGEPRPNVQVNWQRCNAVGLACTTVLQNRSVYTLVPADRFNRIKVVVTLGNSQGQITRETSLSPVVR